MTPTTGPILSAKGVRKIFDRTKEATSIEVLKGIDLTVEPGDRVAIVGKSGTGKSTLLHILGTLEAPSGGEISFMGQNVFKFREADLSAFRNRELGFVFQFHYLMLEFTALENVMMPSLIAGRPKKEARERARELLAKVSLSDRETHKPGQLSGGEQQRVAIARALIMSPKLLLTDEMTGNLDPATGQQIFDLVHSLHREYRLSLVSVTHDEAMARAYSRTFRLTNGVLVLQQPSA
jgi:lipoprotein-releasing system ATP-binding protein